MKWIAHRDILEIRYPNIVRRTDMNVKIIYVYEKMIFVTELMIVMMGQMKMNKFAVSYAISLNFRMNKEKMLLKRD